MDTIYALASARGKSGVAVIRVSGPRAFSACRALAGSVPAPRMSALRMLRDTEGAVLDQALVLAFAAGHSFTGEDVVEFQTHGSPAVVGAVLDTLSAQPGLRVAEPGEFTRRALENECLDLPRIEGLGDLIEAETEAQRRQAMRVFSGELGKKAARWRNDLVRAAALIEATIDFADEDVPVDVMPEVRHILTALLPKLEAEARGVDVAERLRDGFEVAIVGAPNVGKSTLLNYLAGRDAAITSEIAGTTRDIIEVRMDLRGIPVTFLDTAGLRDSSDVIENIGIDRTRDRARQADLRVFLRDGPTKDSGVSVQADDLVLGAKADLAANAADAVSGKTGAGVDAMIAHIVGVLENRVAGVGVAIRARHRAALMRAADAISTTLREIDRDTQGPEIIAEELRSAIVSLDVLVGRVDVEHILDEIFSRFCIGK